MKKVITMLLLCWTALATAQSTTVVLPDGTMMICTTYGTLVECTKV